MQALLAPLQELAEFGQVKEEIRRGCVLAPAGSLKTGRGINVRIKLLEQGQRIVKNQSRLHFYSGTFQMLCRMVLLDTDQLQDSSYLLLPLSI